MEPNCENLASIFCRLANMRFERYSMMILFDYLNRIISTYLCNSSSDCLNSMHLCLVKPFRNNPWFVCPPWIKDLENIVGKGENGGSQHFFLSTMSVRPSVRPLLHALTFSLNVCFSETTSWILMKFHRNVPAMVLFGI